MMLRFRRSHTIKLDQYEINVLVNGLYQHNDCYENVSDLILRLVYESEHMKANRKKKIMFRSNEITLIRTCLLDWRNEQIQDEKETAVEVICELLEKFL